MITRNTHNGITWVDLESPEQQELEDIFNEYNIDARIQDEIVSPTPYPLVVTAPNYIYLILHFPTTDPRGGAKSQEIDFIVGKDFLITSRYEVISSIHSLHRVFESEELLGIHKKNTESTTADLLERILRQLYAAIQEETHQFSRMLDKIEEDVFSGHERQMVLNISLVGRVLLRFGTTLARIEDPLRTFLAELQQPEFFGKKFIDHATRIAAEHDHIVSIVSSYRAVAAELRNTNDSLLSASQNEIIKRLTIITFTAFPLTIIGTLYGMNLAHIPLMDTPNAFWIIVGIMAFTVVLFLSFFKYRKWL